MEHTVPQRCHTDDFTSTSVIRMGWVEDSGAKLMCDIPTISNDAFTNNPKGLNVLLVLVPLSPVIGYTVSNSSKIVFALCVFALIPLVQLHDLGTRQLALRIGKNKAGLVNATMNVLQGNVVETVVAIIALRRCELRVVQTTLIGAILVRLLLVLGLCLFAGGLRFRAQDLNAMLLPAAYHFVFSGEENTEFQTRSILAMSRGVSIVLLLVYGAYLLFQLWSHEYLYQSPVTRSEPLGINLVPSVRLPALNKFPYHSMKGFKRRHPEKTGLDPTSLELGESSRPSAVAMTDRTDSSASDVTLISRTSSAAAETERSQSKFDIEQGQMSTISALSVGSGPTVRLLPDDGISSPRSTQGSSYSTASYSPRHTGPSDDSEWGKVPMQMQMSDSVSSVNSVQEHEAASTTSVPKLGCALNIALLVTVTVVVAFVADQLVESMDEISVHVDKTWIGLILLPSVSAIAECIVAVRASAKDQLRLSISVAVGSSIQTGLLVIPLMVLLGWAMSRPLSLLFDPFESIVLYIAVQTTSHVVSDGKGNWLQGLILVCFYSVIMITFWFYPDASESLSNSVAVCAPLAS
ncbi:hypothetical protein BDV98DRAFT_590920 [Pterulicium gracile]|uniref:Sodium/calcium exchanger membrane region domain-containing protein n=1 Tax=Pterulicium gracile TaxID=1884261 RepID=A0A5C3QPY6_9AGAR|nr:hypothetical protein BDV98DRAFT_590920 [Pterula gracilis]